MGSPDPKPPQRIALAVSQQNIYRGVLQDADPALYLIGRSYRIVPIPLARFSRAVQACIAGNPLQLCVLEQETEEQYPALVPRLTGDELVHIAPHGADALVHEWDSGILHRPLARYTVHTDEHGDVIGLDVHAHHILFDGGATGLIEADLGRFLAVEDTELPSPATGLDRLAEAHRHEAEKVLAAHQRLTETVQRELTTETHLGGMPPSTSGTARRGILRESVQIIGADYDAIAALADQQQIPLHILVTVAAVAVDANHRHSTDALVVHAVDNRFGDPVLDVATCLVNSVAQSVRFAAFASVRELAAALDRGYVKAMRRRWFREELYRRIYLTINRAPQTEALALNYLPQPCAPELRPFLDGPPATTDIGPIECPTVAAVHDEANRTLTLSIWDGEHPLGDDAGSVTAASGTAAQIAAALQAFPTGWDLPVAMSVNGWSELRADGTCVPSGEAPRPGPTSAASWFLDPNADIGAWRQCHPYVDGWISWLVAAGVEPGSVLVFTDDHTDKTLDLLVACHLAGCGYSVCDSADELAERAATIAGHSAGSSLVIDVAATELGDISPAAQERVRSVADDPELATRIAYVMPTSGSTGVPKLVPVTHGALALFCQGHRDACGWRAADNVLQCAPLTSDISVEEIFGAAQVGATLVRSTATQSADLAGLCDDIARYQATIVDLPTAIWHLCCEQPEVLEAWAASALRQIVIGGEAVRASAVAKWTAAVDLSSITVMSSYGPTEATVVLTHLPLSGAGVAGDSGSRPWVGRPIAPNTVFIAFGEIVVIGAMASDGYLGESGAGFGTVTDANGHPQRAFATADRVSWDSRGSLVFAGRKDAVVKVAGKRIDTAEITRRIAEDPAICDVAVESDQTRLAVWFATPVTAAGEQDRATEDRIRGLLLAARVPGFVVTGIDRIPRKAGGKVDADLLPASCGERTADAGQAGGLAALWSQCLDRDLQPDSSLLAEGVGSLDLIRILPATRRYLGRQLSLLDVIGADSATRLIEHTDGMGMDELTAAEIGDDLASLTAPLWHPCAKSPSRVSDTVLVLGASGILGTGFARAIGELRAQGFASKVVLATTSTLPDREPWRSLAHVTGVRTEHVAPHAIAELIRTTEACTVVNAIGNTNVVVPYRDLRPANVEVVAGIVAACAAQGAGLVHLSTSVVSAQVTARHVVDPRVAPYPYAASKALAELVVAGSAEQLAFSLVRLPRVLGEPYQLRASADILVALADACAALGAHPAVTLTEEVTSAQSAALAIMGMVTSPLGRTVTVLRGQSVRYAELLERFGAAQLDVQEWKHRLDDSAWAQRNPRRWAVIDAWLTLGMRLGERSYAQYLAEHATLDLNVNATTEVISGSVPLPELITQGLSAELSAPASRLPVEELTEEMQ